MSKKMIAISWLLLSSACTDVNNTYVMQGPGVDAGELADGAVPGHKPVLGEGNKPGKPGTPGPDGSIWLADGAVGWQGPDGAIVRSDGAIIGSGNPVDAGLPAGSDAGEVSAGCPDARWAPGAGGTCCFDASLPSEVKPLDIQLTAGQASGSFDMPFSHGYGSVAFIPAAGTKSYNVNLMLKPDPAYSNEGFKNPGRNLAPGVPVSTNVRPIVLCDDSLPTGDVLHFTFTVTYLAI